MSTSSFESGCCKKCKHNFHRNTSKKAATGKTTKIITNLCPMGVRKFEKQHWLNSLRHWPCDTISSKPTGKWKIFWKMEDILRVADIFYEENSLREEKFSFYYWISVLLKTTRVLTWSNITWKGIIYCMNCAYWTVHTELCILKAPCAHFLFTQNSQKWSRSRY